MRAILEYSQLFALQPVVLIISGLVFVLVFQVVVFLWASRSDLIAFSYCVATTALVSGLFAAAVIEAPDRAFSISDAEVVWSLLSFLAVIVGISSVGSSRGQSRAVGDIALPAGSTAHALLALKLD